jgi:high-affinity iron transporter
MLPALSITFREIFEAALIVATIIGILTKLNHNNIIRTVWFATFTAFSLSIIALGTGSLAGLAIHDLFSEGRFEQIFEGVIMIISSVFMTWAVFFLHKTFAHHKLQLLQRVRSTMEINEKRGIFLLVFTAVFREGMEIVLFLSTIYLSSQPIQILGGFLAGAGIAVVIAFFLFRATVRLPVYQAFRATSILLIFFAAGMLMHGVRELTEANILPTISHLPVVTLSFLPQTDTTWGNMVESIAGFTRQMQFTEVFLWSGYTVVMSWLVFFRKQTYINESQNLEPEA